MWGGIDCYYTPFIRLEKGDFRRRDLADIAPENNSDTPVVPQMLPQNADELHQTAQLFISQGYKQADINMGCPFPPVALHGRGSGLIGHPDKVYDILQATTQYPQLQFSLKMRLGWQRPDEWRALVDSINDAPLQHVTLHPRIGKVQYKGVVDMESFRQFCKLCSHPIIYNGDVQSLNEARSVMQEYPQLKGIMMGRGLLARPYLSLLLDKGEDAAPPQEIITRTEAFHNTLYEQLRDSSQGHTQLMQRALAMWQYFLPHAPHKERKAVTKASTPQRYEQAVASLFSRWLDSEKIEL